MTKVIRIKGLKSYRHPKTGKLYCYHRKTNTRIMAAYGTADFFLELARLDKTIQTPAVLPGTLGLVISEYMRSPDWAALRPKTRFSYQRVFLVLQRLEDMPLVKIDRAFVFTLRDTKIFPKHGTWMSNYVVTILGILFRFAQDRGWMSNNPLVERVKRIRSPGGKAANRQWAIEECEVVLQSAPPHLRLPLALAMCAGLRKTDFLSVTMSSIKDGTIAVRTSKRGVAIKIPIHPLLASALSQRPECSALQIAVNSHGQPWTECGFNASFRTFRKKLEDAGLIEPGLTPHGLRHTLGTRLREAGADDRTIADVLGQRATSMARHYSENARFPEAAERLVMELDLTGRAKR